MEGFDFFEDFNYFSWKNEGHRWIERREYYTIQDSRQLSDDSSFFEYYAETHILPLFLGRKK
jgi:hypothetical protein